MFDSSKTDASVDSHYRAIKSSEMTQSDIARARRSIRERKETYLAMNDDLNHQMRNAAMDGDYDKFKEVSASAHRLKEFESHIDSEAAELEQIIGNRSVSRRGKISEEIKTEIHNTYHAGHSNQMQLANEYDVSQSAVNKIVNDDPSKFRRKKP